MVEQSKLLLLLQDRVADHILNLTKSLLQVVPLSHSSKYLALIDELSFLFFQLGCLAAKLPFQLTLLF